jgi:hypothetical protein
MAQAVATPAGPGIARRGEEAPMDAQTSGHPAQVFELPANTRFVVIPPHRIEADLAEQISTLLRETEDPRTLVFAEPGWVIHAIPSGAVVEPLEGARLVSWVRELASRFPRNVQLDPVAP